MPRVREFLKLVRVEYVGFAYMAVLGALAIGGADLELATVGWVAVVNVLVLMWTFAHNDYCDLPVDRQRSELDERVLVKGTISPSQALLVIATGILAALAIGLFRFGAAPALALLGSIAFAFAYNRLSKRLPGADLLFASSATCLCLFGMLAAGGTLTELPGVALVVLAIVFIEHLFFNLIEGGLKDADLDVQGDVDNLATRLIECRDGRMTVSPLFKTLAFGMKAVAIALAALPFVLLDEPYGPAQLALLGLAAVVSVVSLHRLLAAREYDWRRMGQDMIAQEMASRALLPLMLLGRIGVGWVVVILLAPITWYLSTVYFVHGRLFALPKRF